MSSCCNCNKEASSVNDDVQLCLGCTRGSDENVLYCAVCYASVHNLIPLIARKGCCLVPFTEEYLCRCEKKSPLDSYCVDCEKNLCHSCCKFMNMYPCYSIDCHY